MFQYHTANSVGRTPQGVRGLKQTDTIYQVTDLTSHSARSAWIETVTRMRFRRNGKVALRKECVD